jgi:hypothetical protein
MGETAVREGLAAVPRLLQCWRAFLTLYSSTDDGEARGPTVVQQLVGGWAAPGGCRWRTSSGQGRASAAPGSSRQGRDDGLTGRGGGWVGNAENCYV